MFSDVRYPKEVLVEKIIYFCLVAIAFCLPFNFATTGFLLQLIVMLALIDSVLAKKVKLVFSKTVFLLLLFFGLAGLSLFNSPNFAASFYNFQVIVPQYIIVYWLAISYLNSNEKICGIFAAILLSALFVSGFGIFEYFYMQNPETLQLVDSTYFPMLKNRVQSTLGNPNILATFIVIVSSFCLGLLLSNIGNLYKAAIAILLIVSCICLIFTFSRGLWLSLFLVVIFLSMMLKRKLLYLLIPVSALVILGSNHFVIYRLLSSFQGNDTSALLRFAIWESTWAMIKNHPFTGIGWGAYKFVYPEYDFFVNNKEVIIYHAHNMYLNIAAEIGIIALIVFLALLVVHFVYAYKTFTMGAFVWQKACGIGICAIFLSVFLAGFTDYTLFNEKLATIFWLFSAMSFVLWRSANLHYK